MSEIIFCGMIHESTTLKMTKEEIARDVEQVYLEYARNDPPTDAVFSPQLMRAVIIRDTGMENELLKMDGRVCAFVGIDHIFSKIYMNLYERFRARSMKVERHLLSEYGRSYYNLATNPCFGE